MTLATPPRLRNTTGPARPAVVGKRAVEDRRERRPLPARRHVGGAKIPDDGDAEAIGERLAVADLHRQRARRIVEHRLAVEADEVDVARR